MQYFDYFKCQEFLPSCTSFEIEDCIKLGFFDNVLLCFEILDALRSFLSLPIIVTSSYRSKSHNESVGGSSTSQHLYGCAVDFCIKDFDFESLILLVQDFCKESAFNKMIGQVIFYHKRKFIHLGLSTPNHKYLTFIHYEQRDN